MSKSQVSGDNDAAPKGNWFGSLASFGRQADHLNWVSFGLHSPALR
ncbi:hypothetical protein [Spirosoma pollinicola]|nr:hypothetical protein [Spirosoma pollinicola]